MKCILIIAGSDSIGGAGIQADIKTAYKLGYHAVTIISALLAYPDGAFPIAPA